VEGREIEHLASDVPKTGLLLITFIGGIFMKKIKLAEALLRRKELQEKVDILKNIKANALFEVRAQRQRVTDNIDDIVAHVPKLTASQVTEEYDWHARQLRLIDAMIQQANWTCEIELENSIMEDFKPK
jgi:Family of unknown function (DUF6847)